MDSESTEPAPHGHSATSIPIMARGSRFDGAGAPAPIRDGSSPIDRIFSRGCSLLICVERGRIPDHSTRRRRERLVRRQTFTRTGSSSLRASSGSRSARRSSLQGRSRGETFGRGGPWLSTGQNVIECPTGTLGRRRKARVAAGAKLSTGAQRELPEDVGEMCLHGRLGDLEPIGGL
jgi:hypothetical protein